MAKAVRQYDAYIPGLNALLRDLKGLDKDSQAELRKASQDIANLYMAPAWEAAAEQAGPWAWGIQGSIKAKRDRIPAITVGNNSKRFSGGASPTMVRYPTHAGRVRESIPAAFVATGWIHQVKPAYIGDAIREWGAAVDQVVAKFNNGPDY